MDSNPKPPSGAWFHEWKIAEIKRKLLSNKPLTEEEKNLADKYLKEKQT